MDPRLAARRRTVAETRIRAGIRRLLVVVIVVGLGAVGVAVLRSGLFSLDDVEVVGQVQTDPVTLLADAGVVSGVPLIEIDLEAATEALLADPRIAVAEVGRRWPTGLAVAVVERFAVAWVDRGSGWEHTAVDGVVLERGDPGPVAPRIRAGSDREVEAALAFVDSLHPDLAAGMVIDARAADLLATWNGMTIRLGRATDMEAKARALEVVVAGHVEPGSEITLIAPDRPAVRPPTAEEDADDGGSGEGNG
ncbi:MAG TPA: FtsQ-type POTRA domain-containing protein [Acidimicrobiia bacterium]|nr:FtsQ-type POTRA domain-containing protein [Acidimicrobiia bacterium]